MGMILENDLSKLYSIEDISKLQTLIPWKKTVLYCAIITTTTVLSKCWKATLPI